MATLVKVEVPDIGDFKDVPVIEVLVKVGDAIKTETPLVTLGVQHPAVNLHGRFATDRDLPGPVDGGESARA